MFKRFTLPRNGYLDNTFVSWVVSYWDNLIDLLHLEFDIWSLFNTDIDRVKDDDVEFLMFVLGLKATGIYYQKWTRLIKYTLILESESILSNRGSLDVLSRCLEIVLSPYDPEVFFDGGFYAELSDADIDTIGMPEYDVAILLNLDSYGVSQAWESAHILGRSLIPAVTRWIVCLDHFYADYSLAGDLVLD
jgi:hypothetical protein